MEHVGRWRALGGLLKRAMSLSLAMSLAFTAPAIAGTGIAGLDTAFGTVDTAVGGTGYALFTAGLVAFPLLLTAGHYYLMFGALIAMFGGGALIGNRAELGGMVSLTLGASVDGLGQPRPSEVED